MNMPAFCPFRTGIPLSASNKKLRDPHAVDFMWDGEWYRYKVHSQIGHSKNALLNAKQKSRVYTGGKVCFDTRCDCRVRIVKIEDSSVIWEGMLSEVEKGWLL